MRFLHSPDLCDLPDSVNMNGMHCINALPDFNISSDKVINQGRSACTLYTISSGLYPVTTLVVGMTRNESKIDRNLRVLISILHHYLNLKTYASGGGHIKLPGQVNPAQKGEFYVSFTLPSNYPEGFEDNLSIIKEAI